MTLDVMKYTIDRISNITPEMGAPKNEEELFRIVGQTVTPEGIGGEETADSPLGTSVLVGSVAVGAAKLLSSSLLFTCALI